MAKYVREIMTPTNKLIILEPNEPIAKVQKLMNSKNIHSVLIRPPKGGASWRIFTSTDLLLAFDTGMDPKIVPVAEFASIARFSARPEWTLERTLSEMVKNGVKHLVVLDNNDLIGVISSRDIVSNY